MYKILICDDEEKICFLVRDLIDWEQLEAEPVGFAHSGRQALSLIPTLNPDIIITDIRMPETDGLQLISQIYKDYPYISFVIISGYQQFEYASSAIKLGVEDYLLKPIRRRELNETLQKICRRKKQQEESVIKREDLLRQISTIQEKNKQLFLQNIWEYGVCSDDVGNYISQYNLDFKYDNFSIFALKTDISFFYINDSQHSFLNKHICELILSQKDIDITVCRRDMTILCLLNHQLNKQTILSRIQDLFDQIDKYVTSFNCYTETASFVNGQTVEDISNLIVRAEDILRSRIFQGVRRLLLELPDHNEYENISDRFFLEYKKLSSFFDAFDIDKSKNEINLLFSMINPECRDIRRYTELLNEIVRLLSVSLKNSFPAIPESVIETRCHSLYTYASNARSTKEYRQYLSEITCEILREFLQQKRMQGTSPIKKAKDYIAENLSKQFTTADIAKHVNLNPSYLSVLFKQETLQNLKDYIAEQRMSYAMQLLKTTNLTIAAIAANVGYTDTRYFSKQFEKIVGIKPAKFRKLHA